MGGNAQVQWSFKYLTEGGRDCEREKSVPIPSEGIQIQVFKNSMLVGTGGSHL
jgi:hypothetical protein